MAGERCEYCDRPKVTHPNEAVRVGGCWVHEAHRSYDEAVRNREWPASVDREWKRLTAAQEGCRVHRVDWRARALAAEQRIAAVEKERDALRAEVEAMRPVVRLADELVARGFKSDPFHPVPLRARLADAIVAYRATTKEGA